jgi:hypothetical protein
MRTSLLPVKKIEERFQDITLPGQGPFRVGCAWQPK